MATEEVFVCDSCADSHWPRAFAEVFLVAAEDVLVGGREVIDGAVQQRLPWPPPLMRSNRPAA